VAENYHENVLKPMQTVLLQHTDSEQICCLFQFVPAIPKAVVSHTFHQNYAVCSSSSNMRLGDWSLNVDYPCKFTALKFGWVANCDYLSAVSRS